MISIQELIQFSSMVRRRFAEKLSELPWKEVERNREASFQSMKNILLHIIDNEDRIINYAIKNRAKDYVRRNPEEYTSMKMILDHLEEVEKKTQQYFRTMTESELGRRVTLTTTTSGDFNLSVEECLIQSFTEQLYHMGELIALMWQDNIEPPPMQWFWNNPRSPKQGK